MKHEFKPGDLAMIIGGLSDNFGRIVELISLCPEGEVSIPGGRWVTVEEGAKVWLLKAPALSFRKIIDNSIVILDQGPYREKYLMPINSEFELPKENASSIPQ